VPGLGHVGFPLGNLFPALLGDDLAEFLVPVTEFVVDVPEVLRAVDVRQRPPLLEGVVGGGDRLADVRLRPALEPYDPADLLAAGEFVEVVAARPDHEFDVAGLRGEITRVAD